MGALKAFCIQLIEAGNGSRTVRGVDQAECRARAQRMTEREPKRFLCCTLPFSTSTPTGQLTDVSIPHEWREGLGGMMDFYNGGEEG